MPNYNQVLLMGNITRDPQLKQLPNGSSVVDFGLATNRKYRSAAGEDKEETCFVDCAAFGKQAEAIHRRPPQVRQLGRQNRRQAQQGLSRRRKLPVPRRPRWRRILPGRSRRKRMARRQETHPFPRQTIRRSPQVHPGRHPVLARAGFGPTPRREEHEEPRRIRIKTPNSRFHISNLKFQI